MSIGGFTGSDPAPTLEQFQAYVAAGEVHYFIPGNGPGGGAAPNGAQEPGSTAGRAGGGGFGRGGTGEQITTWVAQNFASTSIGGRTVYDLTRPIG
jgi:hypothetical protein